MAIINWLRRWLQPKTQIIFVVDSGREPAKVYGPFNTEAEGIEWANTYFSVNTFYIKMTLNKPIGK